jgi:hypothetical protein
MRDVKTFDGSRERREHVERLERELRKEPNDVCLKEHIVRLKIAWGLRQPSWAA